MDFSFHVTIICFWPPNSSGSQLRFAADAAGAYAIVADGGDAVVVPVVDVVYEYYSFCR